MIEVKPEGSDSQVPHLNQLYIDGAPITAPSMHISPPFEFKPEDEIAYTVSIYNDSVIPLITARSFTDIHNDIKLISLNTNFQLTEYDNIFYGLTINQTEAGVYSIDLDMSFYASLWKRPWSIWEYVRECHRLAKQEMTGVTVLPASFEDENRSRRGYMSIVIPVNNPTLIIESEVLRHKETFQRIHELTEESLKSKLQNPEVERIIRSIEFPPEYRSSGITILSYFAEVLRQKNLSEDVRVSIEQNNLKVSLVIDSPTGQRELIEETLEAYGMVVTRRRPPEFLTTDPYEVAALKNQLTFAEAQLASQRELLAAKREDVESLRVEVKQIREQASEDRARFMSFMEGLISHNTVLANGFKELAQQAAQTQNAALSGALENLYKLIERGVREDDREEVMQNLTTIQREDPGVFQRVFDTLMMGAISEGAGNYLYSWLQFFVGTLPK